MVNVLEVGSDVDEPALAVKLLVVGTDMVVVKLVTVTMLHIEAGTGSADSVVVLRVGV